MTERRGRMAVALLALVGVFVSAYLLLYKMGFYGALACGGGGSCEYVQTSRWATFLGLPVAGWGVGWYVLVLAASLVGLDASEGPPGWIRRALEVLAAGGFLFTVYLTVVELFVLEAICRWCVASAALVVAISALVFTLGRLPSS